MKEPNFDPKLTLQPKIYDILQKVNHRITYENVTNNLNFSFFSHFSHFHRILESNFIFFLFSMEIFYTREIKFHLYIVQKNAENLLFKFQIIQMTMWMTVTMTMTINPRL